MASFAWLDCIINLDGHLNSLFVYGYCKVLFYVCHLDFTRVPFCEMNMWFSLGSDLHTDPGGGEGGGGGGGGGGPGGGGDRVEVRTGWRR